MPTTLHLGVTEQPYVDSHEGTTTGDVAEILEAKYGLFSAFYAVHQQDVADAMANGMAGMLEKIMGGGPAPDDPFKAGMDDVETLFKTFLFTGEAERVGIPGTPTKASLKRKSSRFKTGRNPAAYRPSFIDTGLMEASFKSWVDNAISWRAAAAAYQEGY